MSFPTSPTDGQIYQKYVYDASAGAWKHDILGRNTIFPVGMIYIQLPGRLSPTQMNWPGNWEYTNTSSEYAGDFFRVEGGNAEPFDDTNQTEQLDAFQNHWHTIYTGGNRSEGGSGATYVDLRDNGVARSDRVQDPEPDATETTPRTDIETRPINRTIRIWRRIS